MKRAYLFNPENDLALANFSPTYTAPRNAVKLAEAGALLPFLFSDKDDAVLVSNDSIFYLDYLREHLNISGNVFTPDLHSDFYPTPWGWSPATVYRFKQAGLDISLNEYQDYLHLIRNLSHRRHTITLNRLLQEVLIDIPPLPREIYNIDEVEFEDFINNPVIMKAPWSSSGRGVLASDAFSSNQFCDQMKGMIRRQGSVLIEKKLNRILDFAMLFNYHHGKAVYRGLSMFQCASTGEYLGNLVTPGEVIIDKLLSRGGSLSALTSIRNAVSSSLERLIGSKYNGPIGIDMMLYYDDYGTVKIAPCIEINLRMTMGFVALELAERHLAPESHGLLSIINTSSRNHSDKTSEAHFVNKRLIEGEISLSPPASQFHFIFSAQKADSIVHH